MTAPESPRADVELSSAAVALTGAEEHALCEAMEAWVDSPATSDSAGPYAVVERILADRLAAVQAEPCRHAELPDTMWARLRSAEAERDMLVKAHMKAVRFGALDRARAESAEAERDQLRRWKDEALPVISGLQELGHALGLPLGAQITGPEAIKAAEDLRARLLAVEALAEEWERNDPELTFDTVSARRWSARRLRAVLASPSTHAQRDTETAAQALLKILDPNGEGRGMVCARLLDAAARMDNPSHRGNRFRWSAHARMFRDLAAHLARADSLDTGEGTPG